jgi:hypothetical protein
MRRRARVRFDYGTHVFVWPWWIRLQWPNTIATLVLIERDLLAERVTVPP